MWARQRALSQIQPSAICALQEPDLETSKFERLQRFQDSCFIAPIPYERSLTSTPQERWNPH